MQVLVNGLINGLAIALVAVAFNVVYQPARVFYIASAGLYAIAPFLAWALVAVGCPIVLAALASVVACALLSCLFEVANHGPLERRGAPMGVHLVSSLGIYMLLIHGAALIWGNDPRVLREGLDTVYRPWGLVLTRAQLVSGVASLVLLGCFAVWLWWTRMGLLFRGLSENPVGMALLGQNTRRLRLLAFGLSGASAAIAALLVAYDVGFDPHGGLPALLLGVVAVIIGGRNSYVGPIVGAILLGVVRSQVVWHLSARWQEAVTFLILAVFLLVRPDGLFRRAVRLESAQ